MNVKFFTIMSLAGALALATFSNNASAGQAVVNTPAQTEAVANAAYSLTERAEKIRAAKDQDHDRRLDRIENWQADFEEFKTWAQADHVAQWSTLVAHAKALNSLENRLRTVENNQRKLQQQMRNRMRPKGFVEAGVNTMILQPSPAIDGFQAPVRAMPDLSGGVHFRNNRWWWGMEGEVQYMPGAYGLGFDMDLAWKVANRTFLGPKAGLFYQADGVQGGFHAAKLFGGEACLTVDHRFAGSRVHWDLDTCGWAGTISNSADGVTGRAAGASIESGLAIWF